MYALVNEANIKTLTKELLDYLKVSDAEFKPDLTGKICMLVQRFAPDKQWHLDSLLQVCCDSTWVEQCLWLFLLAWQGCYACHVMSLLC